MKESLLWKHLKPELSRVGKFQKISDRFTPGVPDMLGISEGIPLAIEFKELKGTRVLRVSFRPGQLDWLRDWERGGGVSWILSTTHDGEVMAHTWRCGEDMEKGFEPSALRELASVVFPKTRTNTWRNFIEILLEASRKAYGGVKSSGPCNHTEKPRSALKRRKTS